MRNLPVYLVRGIAVTVLLVMVSLGAFAGLGALNGACADPSACLDYGKTRSDQLVDRVLGTPEHPDPLTVAFHRWGDAVGGLGGQLLVKVLGFGVLFSFLVALGLAATQLTQRSRPARMAFGGDPRQLRGSVRNAHQRPDGTWEATTTNRQTAWLGYQAKRAGIQRKED